MQSPARAVRYLGVIIVLAALPALRIPPIAPASHLVQLDRNRFLPAETRAGVGDTIRFVNGEGGPHNVQFMAESISVAAKPVINGAIRNGIAPLTGPMLIIPKETFTFVVPDLPAGRYAFLCSPHWANMRGGITVVR